MLIRISSKYSLNLKDSWNSVVRIEVNIIKHTKISLVILFVLCITLVSGCNSHWVQKYGKGDYWETIIEHNESTGEINYEINYIGTEPTIKIFIFEYSSEYFNTKGGFGKSKTEGGLKMKMTEFSNELDLNKQTIKLMLTWNNKAEEIILE
ncbi:hypothetical protein [Paenibacillus sp. FSL L8-0333]|uniref:hypothetical protein n=1 Tax=unclassified Paenibacillus TaxID=185978 RepID=UPI0030D21C18